jgi:hypothetical protein
MPRRPIWLVDLGDGTWAVSCMACRIALYRGSKAGADRAASRHYCEPVLPLGRRRSPDHVAYPGPGVAARSRTPVDGRAAHRQPIPREGASS